VLNSLAVGTMFADRYRVVRVIKSGGMGAVYAVFDEKTASERALKVMHPDLVGDPELRARFDQEARVTGGVVSDHVVQTFDAGVEATSNTPFLVMELLRGEDLGTKLKRGELPTVDLALQWLRHAALGLDKTHAASIVHRDLKPDNLFVTRRDDGSFALKILDFGVAKVISEAASKTTKALGTPLYMPVEQIQGSRTIGPECDRYALGHIAYAMLTGEAYWLEDSRKHGVIAVCMRVAEGLDEPATQRALRRKGITLPPAFDAWFARAVARDAEGRFSSCEAMIDALEPILRLAPPSVAPRTGSTDRAGLTSGGAALESSAAAPTDPTLRGLTSAGATGEPRGAAGGAPTAPGRRRLAALAVGAAAVLGAAALAVGASRNAPDAPSVAASAHASPASTASAASPAALEAVVPSASTAHAAPASASSDAQAPAASATSEPAPSTSQPSNAPRLAPTLRSASPPAGPPRATATARAAAPDAAPPSPTPPTAPTYQIF
jgi:serine/threonine protein kinase